MGKPLFEGFLYIPDKLFSNIGNIGNPFVRNSVTDGFVQYQRVSYNIKRKITSYIAKRTSSENQN